MSTVSFHPIASHDRLTCNGCPSKGHPTNELMDSVLDSKCHFRQRLQFCPAESYWFGFGIFNEALVYEKSDLQWLYIDTFRLIEIERWLAKMAVTIWLVLHQRLGHNKQLSEGLNMTWLRADKRY